MTSQQAAAIVSAAGIGSQWPTINTTTAEDYHRAIVLLEAAGLTAVHSTFDAPCSAGVYDSIEFATDGGYVTLISPVRAPEPEPIEQLAGVAAAEVDRAEAVALAEAYSADTRIAITEAGRETLHGLRVIDGGRE